MFCNRGDCAYLQSVPDDCKAIYLVIGKTSFIRYEQYSKRVLVYCEQFDMTSLIETMKHDTFYDVKVINNHGEILYERHS